MYFLLICNYLFITYLCKTHSAKNIYLFSGFRVSQLPKSGKTLTPWNKSKKACPGKLRNWNNKYIINAYNFFYCFRNLHISYYVNMHRWKGRQILTRRWKWWEHFGKRRKNRESYLNSTSAKTNFWTRPNKEFNVCSDRSKKSGLQTREQRRKESSNVWRYLPLVT